MLSPGDIEHLATAVENTARRLAEIGEGLENRARLAEWQGASAEIFRETMRQRRLRCDQDAETLRAIAVELRAAAAAFRSELNALHRLEGRVRDWLSDRADDLSDLADVLPNPLTLPPTGSPLWRETSNMLGRLGVRF